MLSDYLVFGQIVLIHPAAGSGTHRDHVLGIRALSGIPGLILLRELESASLWRLTLPNSRRDHVLRMGIAASIHFLHAVELEFERLGRVKKLG